MIGVIGQQTAGLIGYQGNSVQNGPGDAPFCANEATFIASSIDPREIPDRWEGLDSFEAARLDGRCSTDARPA